MTGFIMASFKEIQAQIEVLQFQASEQRSKELSGAIHEIKELMKDFGITVDDLPSIRKKNAAKKSRVVQFRNAETGDTWSGRGRMPKWLSGKNREQFRI
jgi:DNA-binding protein H-NS